MITVQSSFPVFIVQHIINAKTFYTEHFDFSVVFENEWYLHLISSSGVQVGFMLPNQPSQPEIFHPPFTSDGVIFSLEVENADIAYQSACDAELEIALTLRSEDWGQRHFSIKDPNGVYIDVVQTIEMN